MQFQDDITKSRERIFQLTESIGTIIKGKFEETLKVITALVAGGHILIEDNPGTGKTAMAKSLAFSIANDRQEDHQSAHVVFKRIQFTPDLLPMDLIGTYIFDDSKKDFIFKKGPLFANIVLADEINRASPKVQSALLECMAESQITLGEVTHYLEDPFFVIATQNPVEMEGTYPLPAAQLDRFYLKISFGYVSEEAEIDIFKNYLTINKIKENVKPVLSKQDLLEIQQISNQVYLNEEIINSVKNILTMTRNHPDIELGASTRSGIIFLKCLRAFALIQGRTYVIEDDIKFLAKDVFNHRLIFRNNEAKEKALKEIVDTELERLSKVIPVNKAQTTS